MRTWLWIPVALVSFFLGAGAGVMLTEDQHEVPRPAYSPPADLANTQQAAAARDSAAEAEPERPPMHRGPAQPADVQPPSNSSERLIAALQAIPVADMAEGSLSIAGRVTDAEGNPLAGVVIRCIHPVGESSGPVSMFARTIHGQATLWDDLASEVESLVAERRIAAGDGTVGLSGPDGHFQVGGLAHRPYYVVGKLEGHTVSRRNGGPRVYPGQTAELVAVRCARVVIRAFTEEGGQAEQFQASVLRFDGQLQRVGPILVRGGAYHYELTKGQYHIDCSRADPPARAEPTRLTVTGTEGVIELSIALKSSPAVRVTATLEDGLLVGPAQLRLTEMRPGETLIEVRARSRPEAHEGYGLLQPMIIRTMPAGRCHAALYAGRQLVQDTIIEHQGGITATELVARPPAPGECIVCRVEPSDRAPAWIDNFALHMAEPRENRVTLSGWQLPNGEYRLYLPELAANWRPESLVGLTTGMASATAPLTHLGPQAIVLQLPRSTHLVVDLVPGAGRAHNASVSLKDQQGKSAGNASRNPSVPRLLAFGGLTPGTYTMLVTTQARYTIPILSRQVIIGDEPSSITVELPELFEVRFVSRSDTTKSAQVLCETPGLEFRHDVFVNQEQTVSLMLPAGNYTVKSQTGTQQRSMPLAVFANREVSIDD